MGHCIPSFPTKNQPLFSIFFAEPGSFFFVILSEGQARKRGVSEPADNTHIQLTESYMKGARALESLQGYRAPMVPSRIP